MNPSFRKETRRMRCFTFESGKVKLTVVSKRGKEAVIAILPEASFFGEGCLAGQPVRMATASAVQRSTHVRVEKPIMLTDSTGTGICRTLSRLPAFPEHSHGSGLGGSPLQLQRKTPRSASPTAGQLRPGIQADTAVAKMSQETLAEMIGTTRSRVSFFMNRFQGARLH